MSSGVREVIEEFEQLSESDKEYVAEIIQKQKIELKREEIFNRSREARSNMDKEHTSIGTAGELLQDLEK